MKNKRMYVLLGIIICICIAATGVFANSRIANKDLFYNDIKIMIDDNKVTPTDANGNYVEPFIIDGTTYLPIRAVASALELDVKWDGETNTVRLYKDKGSSQTNNQEAIDKFCDSISGIWVDMNSRRVLDDEMAFDLYTILNKELFFAVYPGGGDRPGKIVAVTDNGNGKYTLKLYYSEGWFMGDYYDSKEIDCLIKLENGTITFLNDESRVWTYMGKTMDEARKNVLQYQQKDLAEKELVSIAREKLGVPDNLNITYKFDGEKHFWESGQVYNIRIDFYENGEFVASTFINTENGDLTHGIMPYSPPESY